MLKTPFAAATAACLLAAQPAAAATIFGEITFEEDAGALIQNAWGYNIWVEAGWMVGVTTPGQGITRDVDVSGGTFHVEAGEWALIGRVADGPNLWRIQSVDVEATDPTLYWNFRGTKTPLTTLATNGFETVTPGALLVANFPIKFESTADFRFDNVQIASAAPEPAAWALMIAGFGFAGAALRRRGLLQSVSASGGRAHA